MSDKTWNVASGTYDTPCALYAELNAECTSSEAAKGRRNDPQWNEGYNMLQRIWSISEEEGRTTDEAYEDAEEDESQK